MSIYTNKIYFSFGLKIRAIIKAKAIEAVTPVAADFIPPENIPINPTLLTSFITPFARLLPNPKRGIVAPAPAKSTILGYIPIPPRIQPKTTKRTSILAYVNLVLSIKT